MLTTGETEVPDFGPKSSYFIYSERTPYDGPFRIASELNTAL